MLPLTLTIIVLISLLFTHSAITADVYAHKGYPPFRGQEASQVGAAHALDDADWLVPISSSRRNWPGG